MQPSCNRHTAIVATAIAGMTEFEGAIESLFKQTEAVEEGKYDIVLYDPDKMRVRIRLTRVRFD